MYKKKLLFPLLTLLLLTLLSFCRDMKTMSYREIAPMSTPTRLTPARKSLPPQLTSKAKSIDGYLSVDNNHLIWIQWKENETGNMQGTLRMTAYNTRNNTLKHFEAPFTGVHDGDSITLSVRYSILSTVSEPGTLKEGVLHITPRVGAQTINAYGTSTQTYEAYLKQLQIKQSSAA
jgi:hypothetical protein